MFDMNENSAIVDTAGICDLVIDQGSSVELVMEFHNDAGDPYSLVGRTITLDVKSVMDIDAVPLISKSVGSGLSVSTNKLTIVFSAAETGTLKGTAYFYDILFVSGTEKKYMVKGKLLVNKSVTK